MPRAALRSHVRLTPRFSEVPYYDPRQNRFNGFSPTGKPLKRFALTADHPHPAEAGC